MVVETCVRSNDPQTPSAVTNDVLRSLLDLVDSPAIATDKDGRVLWMNRAARDLAANDSRDASEVLGLDGPFEDGRFEDDALYCRTAAPAECFIARRELLGDIDAVVLTAAPSATVVQLPRANAGVGASTPWGRERGIDPNSGLLDRASIEQMLETEVARSRRYTNPLSVVVLSVTPTAGEGDDLAALARILAEETRWADSTGRWAHDVAVLVLPETGEEAVRAFAGKLGRRLRSEAGMAMRCRLGLATWHRGDDRAALIRRAFADLDRAT